MKPCSCPRFQEGLPTSRRQKSLLATDAAEAVLSMVLVKPQPKRSCSSASLALIDTSTKQGWFQEGSSSCLFQHRFIGGHCLCPLTSLHETSTMHHLSHFKGMTRFISFVLPSAQECILLVMQMVFKCNILRLIFRTGTVSDSCQPEG